LRAQRVKFGDEASLEFKTKIAPEKTSPLHRSKSDEAAS
jgi:hypothetical protein